ncbi:MAG: MFS transporter [Bacillota bacterium]|nr:MFS transporter [Bacillota bacterium]
MKAILTNTSKCNYNLDEFHKTEKLNISLFLGAKTISLLGSNIYTFALSLYILKVTGSGTSFAINVLIGMIPKIILGPFAGILSDRVSRKKLTVTLDIISGLVVLGLLFLSSLYGLRIVFIYVVSLILSTINVFYDTALTSSLPNLVDNDKLMKINAFSSVSTSLSGILSPVAAGIIFGLVPIYYFLIIDALSFFFSSSLESFMNFNLNKALDCSTKAAMSIETFKSEMTETFLFVKKQKIMYSLFKYSLILNFFLVASISVVYPYIINTMLRMSSSQFGILQTFVSIGILISSIIIGNRKEKEKKLKTTSLGLGAIGLILILGGIPTLSLSIFKMVSIEFSYYIILFFLLGFILILINTPILVSIQRLTPENLRGKITGILGTLSGGIAPLGVFLAGILMDKIHPFIILLASGGFIIASAIILLNSRHMKEF